MQRSVLHTVVALLAAVVLMLQHAPIVLTGQGSHEHCIHCTENYCTKSGCGHKHRANPQKGHAVGHGSDQEGAHRHAHAHGASQTEARSSSDRAATVGTTIRPCGSPPSGIITLNLDKFVGAASALTAQHAFERPSSARYVGLTDQLVADHVFRPPVLG